MFHFLHVLTRPRRRIQDKDVPVIDYLKINNTMTIKDLRNPGILHLVFEGIMERAGKRVVKT
jgi:hypothetical protein